PGAEIDLHGAYPFNRYFSFITYGSNGAPIGNVSLHDTEINPDPGSTNPFTTPDAPTNLDQRQYSVRILGSAQANGPNTLAGLTNGQQPALGFLVYRLSLPDTPGDPYSGVPLPSITPSRGPIPTCTPAERRLFDLLFRPIADRLVAASAPDPSTVVRGANL